MTVEQWAALSEDVPGELVDGQLVEEEMADFVHEAAVAWLVWVLSTWARSRDGRVYGSEGKLRIGPRHGRKPDVTLFLGGRRPRRAGPSDTPPDIAIEVVSPSPRDARRDRVEKLGDYAAVGISSYWLVDLEQRTLEILTLGPAGRYESAACAESGRVAEIPGCPGLELDLDALWAEIDELQS